MPKRLTEEELNEKLPPYTKVDWSTYKGTNQKCRFIDNEYGEFWTKVQNIIYYGSSGHPKRYCAKRGKTRQLKENDISQRLPPEISIDMSTYKGYHTKAKFIDKDHGEFWADPASVLCQRTGHPNRWKEKFKKTCQERYGVTHSSKNRDIIQKMARGQNNHKSVYHWETNEICECVGSYEYLVLNHLNKNKIKYIWQIPIQLKQSLKTYICDLFLVEKQIYVEIKGFFRKDALEKWQEFIKQYPNSELWDKQKLKSLGIL